MKDGLESAETELCKRTPSREGRISSLLIYTALLSISMCLGFLGGLFFILHMHLGNILSTSDPEKLDK